MGNLGEDTKNRNFSLFSFDSGLYDGLVNFVSCLLLFCVLLIQLIGRGARVGRLILKSLVYV